VKCIGFFQEVAIMTDWELITEQIQNAMRAVDKASEAGENLRNETTPQNVDAFTEQLNELCDHLITMKQILEHESGFSMDELADVLSKLLSGEPAPYRTTKRYKSEQ
jgi:uncharacterized protein YaaR (DUF327 family)